MNIKIKHKDFSERLTLACDNHPHVPPIHYGRLGWLAEKLSSMNIKVSTETIRRWLSGEAYPRQSRMTALTELLQVEQSWLALGDAQGVTQKERKLRRAEADGAVNLVAGALRMSGAAPAFPMDGDARAENDRVDLYAIIRGANYPIHVTSSIVTDGEVEFVITERAKNDIVIAVTACDNLDFRFYEAPWDAIERNGVRKRGAYVISGKFEEIESLGLRRLTTFSERF